MKFLPSYGFGLLKLKTLLTFFNCDCLYSWMEVISGRKEMKNVGVKLHLDQRLSKQNCKCSNEHTKLLKGRINKSILKNKALRAAVHYLLVTRKDRFDHSWSPLLTMIRQKTFTLKPYRKWPVETVRFAEQLVRHLSKRLT